MSKYVGRSGPKRLEDRAMDFPQPQVEDERVVGSRDYIILPPHNGWVGELSGSTTPVQPCPLQTRQPVAGLFGRHMKSLSFLFTTGWAWELFLVVFPASACPLL